MQLQRSVNGSEDWKWGKVEEGEWKDGKTRVRKLIIDIDVCISMIKPHAGAREREGERETDIYTCG